MVDLSVFELAVGLHDLTGLLNVNVYDSKKTLLVSVWSKYVKRNKHVFPFSFPKITSFSFQNGK